jgi:hypothetical protein
MSPLTLVTLIMHSTDGSAQVTAVVDRTGHQALFDDSRRGVELTREKACEMRDLIKRGKTLYRGILTNGLQTNLFMEVFGCASSLQTFCQLSDLE